MPTPRKAGRFGGSAAHHKHIVANLATELIRHGRITTTHAKAKTVQPTAERLITFAKRGDIHSRRQAGKVIRDNDVLHHLFAEVGPANAGRDGGYTRVLKLGPRKGDAAPMALIELVEATTAAQDGRQEDAPRRRWSLRRRAGDETAAAAGTAAAGTAAVGTALEEPVAEEEETEGPQVKPEDVEARLAAEDEAEAEADADVVAETDDDAAAEDEAEAAVSAEDDVEADVADDAEASEDEDEDEDRA